MASQDHPWTPLKRIGDLSDEAVVVYKLKERRMVYMSPAGAALTGITTDASYAQIEGLLNDVVEQDRAYVVNQLSQLHSNSFIPPFVFRVLRADSPVYLRLTGYLMDDPNVLALFFRDITKEKEHENYLVEFGARKNTALDTLAHNISGALTLMQHLSTEAEKRVTSSDDASLRNYLRLVRENSKQCLKIIADVWDHEHKKSPDISVKLSRVDLVELTAFIVEELRNSFPDRKFVFNASSDSVYIKTDEVKVLQIVNNFTSNAVKFSHTSGQIVISIVDHASEVVVSVQDHGIGIPEKLKPLIFERHSAKGRTGLNGEKSTGLGLWICNVLTGLIGGRIWFESQEGKGSTFYFSLPKTTE